MVEDVSSSDAGGAAVNPSLLMEAFFKRTVAQRRSLGGGATSGATLSDGLSPSGPFTQLSRSLEDRWRSSVDHLEPAPPVAGGTSSGLLSKAKQVEVHLPPVEQ